MLKLFQAVGAFLKDINPKDVMTKDNAITVVKALSDRMRHRPIPVSRLVW